MLTFLLKDLDGCGWVWMVCTDGFSMDGLSVEGLSVDGPMPCHSSAALLMQTAHSEAQGKLSMPM